MKLAIPATLALLAKAVYNLVDTASRTVTTVIGLSVIIGIALCVGGIVFIDPLMRAFGASEASLPLAKDYAFWMFIAALANLPAQSMNCAARAESSVKISSIAVITGAALNILLSKPLILLFNRNPVIIGYGSRLLISQVALYPVFGLCYMMTITFQTIGASRYGLFLSAIRQGLFYIPFILTLPKLLGVTGIYFSQPAADVLTIFVCVCSIRAMKRIASQRMGSDEGRMQP